MWLRFSFLVVNLLALKVGLSEATVKPTFTYSSSTLPTVQSTPVNSSPLKTTSIPTAVIATSQPSSPVSTSPIITPVATPASTVIKCSTLPAATIVASPIPTVTSTAIPASTTTTSSNLPTVTIVSSPIPTATTTATQIPAKSLVASAKPTVITNQPFSSVEPKAYFLPGPVANPKVTILADIPSVAEAKPCADSNIIEIIPLSYPDPGVIEVKGKFVDPIESSLPLSPSIPVKTVIKENGPKTPVKRVTMACEDEDPFVSSTGSRLPIQQPICPGISQIDMTPISIQKVTNNPIDFEGLFEGFMSCL